MKRITLAHAITVTAALSSAVLAASCSGDDGSTIGDSGAPDITSADASMMDAKGDAPSAADGAVDSGDAFVDNTCLSPPCASQVSLGLEHACAVMRSGSVECWGLNANGELGSGGGSGDGGAFDPSSQSIPQVVKGIGAASYVTAGWYHTCALLQDSSVWCWGDNSHAQLGQTANGSPVAPQPAPQKITLTGTPVEIEAGGWHTCARMMAGGVQCWGFNADGEVGTGSKVQNAISPPYVPGANTVGGFATASDLGIGDRSSCALINGGVQCIGSNTFGQLGRGTPTTLPFDPAAGPVGGVAGATDVARANGQTQCAILDGGAVKCWGRDDSGQLLDDSGVNFVVAPVAIPSVTTAAEIAPGGNHVCAVLASGDVVCWGGDAHGQTGQTASDGGTGAATKVSGVSKAVHVASGWGDFSCATIQTGSTLCWGANFESQLGRGTDGVLLPFDEKPAAVKLQ